MKALKGLFTAVLIVVMLLAMVIPAAAVDYTITINGKNGFTATVYKIADFDKETGEFSNFVEKSNTDHSVQNAIKDSDEAALLTAAEALSATNLSDKVVATKTFTATESQNATVGAGVYYVKWTTVPANVTSAQSSVCAVPYYNNGNWVNTVTIQDTKTATDTPDASKTFTTDDAAEKFVKAGEVFNFTLTGSVPGSLTLPAQEIKFVDRMNNGLAFNGNLKVYGVKANDTATEIASTGYTSSNPSSGDKTFTITFSASQTPALYTAEYKTIKITYDAKLTGDDINYTTAGNVNTLTYTYKNNANVESEPITKTRKVETFKFEVKKTDTDNNVITDKTAGFTLYTNSDCAAAHAYTNESITGEVTTTNGIATFKGLKPGTYYVKETTAPDGYNLNSHVFPIIISDNGTVSGDGVTNNQLAVKDTKIIVPNTGGEGTLIFTIIGASLIATAAILFVVYKKKSASAK